MSQQVVGLEPQSGITEPRRSEARRRLPPPLILLGYSIAALAAIFFLPYRVPLHPSLSFSYAFGYSNRIGILLTLIFCGAAALWIYSTRAFRLSENEYSPVSRRALVVALSVTALLCGIGYPFITSPAPVADAAYLVNRIQLAAAGHTPYVAFEYAYGPLFIYGPLWIAHLLRTGIPQGYFWFWVLTELAGVLLLFQVINGTDIPSRARSNIFLLLCAASASSMALGAATYTFTRFALAPWFAFRILRADTSSRGPARGLGRCFLLAAFFYMGLLLVSPEIAIAFGIGTAIFLFLRGNIGSGGWWAGYAILLAAMAVSTYAADRAHALDTMKVFSTGARDTPIYPSIHVLLFLFCFFLGLVHLLRKVINREHTESVYLILVSLPLLPSALGTCDPLHVFFSGLGFLIVGLSYLSHYRRSWDLTRVAFVVSFVIILFGGVVLERLYQYQGKAGWFLGRGERALSLTQKQVFPDSRGILYAPFGFKTKRTEEYPVPWIDTGKYLALLNAPSMHEVLVKEQELNADPGREIVLPADYSNICSFDQSSMRLWLNVEYGSPFLMRLRHSRNPYSVLCSFIEARYHPVQPSTAQSLKYQLWARNR